MFATAIIKSGGGNRLLTIKGTNAVVASYGRVEKGVVLLLPRVALYEEGEEVDEEPEAESEDAQDEEEEDFLDSLFELISALRLSKGDFELPEWSGAYHLPGEAEELELLEAAETAAAAALSEVDDRKRSLAALRQKEGPVCRSGASTRSPGSRRTHSVGCQCH